MEPENRQACPYCEILVPQSGPLLPRDQSEFHSLGLSISIYNCGFCNAVAAQLKPDWQQRWKPVQVRTFEEFLEKLDVCASVTDVQISYEGISWGTWNVNLRTPRWLTSEGDTTYRFHIQSCEPPCESQRYYRQESLQC